MKADFKQAMEDILEIWIYSEVAPDGYDWWTDEVVPSETSAASIRDKLAAYPGVKEIKIYINSCGGSVKEGYGIYSQLKRHPAAKTVYVDGFANSIASIIAMAGDKIIMSLGSMMGIHNMMDWVFGNAAEHRKCAEDLDRMMQGNRQIYLQRSGGKITLERLTELLDHETMLTAQECLDYGFCDEIAGAASDLEKVAQMMQRMNTGIAQQARYYSQLKQSFTQAMEMVPKPENPPAVNKPMTFLSALMRREGE